ncbi:MAG: hypothetical protein CR977_02460 [Gammaproteobacteria bacterium]|nr:MAG: hypothetical protein CR977_02460 [Gammaproteobacteria bacterium]
MSKKTTGLAQFTKQGNQAGQPETQDSKPREKQRGKGDVVALTVRLSREDWQRVHQLALSEGVSIQRLAVDGLSRLFEEKGLKKLST